MAQAELKAELGSDYRVFVTMRYWHPMSDEIIAARQNYRTGSNRSFASLS